MDSGSPLTTSIITETLAITGTLHREAEWIKKRSHKHKHTKKTDIFGLTHLWEIPYRPLTCFLIIPKHTHTHTHTHTHIYTQSCYLKVRCYSSYSGVGAVAGPSPTKQIVSCPSEVTRNNILLLISPPPSLHIPLSISEHIKE